MLHKFKAVSHLIINLRNTYVSYVTYVVYVSYVIYVTYLRKTETVKSCNALLLGVTPVELGGGGLDGGSPMSGGLDGCGLVPQRSGGSTS